MIRSRAANVICMLSEKLMTMISGVITFRNMLSWKPSQPSAPSDSRMAASGGAAAMIMKETRRKNRMAIRQPAARPERVVDDAVALQRLADFELHHRHAGQLRRDSARPRSSSSVRLISSMAGPSRRPSTMSGSSDSTISAKSPVSDSSRPGSVHCSKPCYDLAATLDSGQAFRWQRSADGSSACSDSWTGVVRRHQVRLTPTRDGIRAETTEAGRQLAMVAQLSANRRGFGRRAQDFSR